MHTVACIKRVPDIQAVFKQTIDSDPAQGAGPRNCKEAKPPAPDLQASLARPRGVQRGEA
jgi:hypothetical protein